MTLFVLALLALAGLASAGCPFGHDFAGAGARVEQRSLLETTAAAVAPQQDAVSALDFKAVQADITKALQTSQSFWPADHGQCTESGCKGGTYAGLMIRLAWHCAGSYRSWDGRGGCDGGRIRFTPEGAWPDNTNLDKALKVLAPIKRKYGAALSWGDLIVLAGDTAITSMGGPVLGFCAGRIDDADGNASLPLGPTEQQKLVAPCKPGQGKCSSPLGASTIGLIYVNPEGPMAEPVPEKSAPQIREVFGRMNMNDSETVALIGGGHAFGKTHGACPTGAGPDPIQAPLKPWPGTCGTGALKGRGPNTFTSGFEGAWTTTPTSWGNQYFRNLLEYDWVVHKGPGGHMQWKPKLKPGSKRAAAPDIMMLTTDVALLKDPKYLALVKQFATDQAALDNAFKHAWYKLTTRDMGPHSRCLGPLVPPPQPFQRPLPAAAPITPVDVKAVTADVKAALTKRVAGVAADADAGGKTSTYSALLSSLAYQCASTFRKTDKSGGCDGARIRFSPEKDWPVNKGLDGALKVLQPVKDKYPALSWADLIVLAGGVALGEAAGKPALIPFCPGRTDALDGTDSAELAPRAYAGGAKVAVPDNWRVAGLTPAEGVALAGRPRSAAVAKAQGYSGTWDDAPGVLDNTYYKLLMNTNWVAAKSPSGKAEFRAPTKAVFMTPEDMVVKDTPELAAIATEYAKDNGKWLAAFASAWTKLMVADRWKGPAGNICGNGGALKLPV